MAGYNPAVENRNEKSNTQISIKFNFSNWTTENNDNYLASSPKLQEVSRKASSSKLVGFESCLQVPHAAF
jgi:hypothetical protein